jgi:hypothetical protein
VTSASYWLEASLAAALVLGGCEEDGRPAPGDGAGTTEGAPGEMDASSSGGDESGESSSGGEGDDIVCDAPMTRCGQTCVDLEADPNNCGICGLSCVVPNGESACSAGICALAACDFGWVDCDGTISTGCEMLNECDGASACSTECGSTGALDCADPCAPACSLPAESCNLADDDCDGQCDEGEIEGCRVGIHVANDPVLGQVLMVDPADADAYGVTIEQMNAFYLYAQAGGGTQPLNRCNFGSLLAYSPDNDCESYGSIESTLAFFSPQDKCGAIPLYRLLMGTNQVRMTASATELSDLVAQGWIVDPGFTGFAWPTP